MRARSRKQDSYGKYVKEMYWPKVSEAKQQELQNLKHKL